MKRYEMIKPVPGFKVWDPQAGAFLAEGGRRVLYDQYWSRRQTEGAIKIVPTPTPPVTTNAPPPVADTPPPPVTKKAPDPLAENGIAKTAEDAAKLKKKRKTKK